MTWLIVFCSLVFVFGLIIGAAIGVPLGEREGREEARWQRKEAMARRTHPVYRQRPPELHHELSPGAWLEVAPDPLTDSQYTAGMAARMDRFLEELFAVPYSADELWDRQ